MKASASVIQLLCLIAFVSCNEHRGDETQQDILAGNQFAKETVKYKPGEHTGFSKYRARSLYGKKKVAITYDDGPDRNITPKILDLLKMQNAVATFFVYGKKALDHPEIIKRMIQEGHTVGLHTYSQHASANTISQKVFKEDITDSLKAIRKLGWTDTKEIYYRFPFGAYGSMKRKYHHFETLKDLGQELYGENCFNFVFWDIDTSDWYLGDPKRSPNLKKRGAKIAKTTMAQLEGGASYDHDRLSQKKGPRIISKKSARGGGIILMHDVYKPVIEATRLLLIELQKNDYEIVPLNEIKEYEYEYHKTCNLNDPNFK